MHEKHSNRGVEHTNYTSTLSDNFEEIRKERGRYVMKIDSRVMEFIHDLGAVFTLYEKYGTGYVGCLMSSKQDTRYYEVDPSKVVSIEIEWPESGCQLVELAVLPLLNGSWQLTYYDEEYAKTRFYELFNGEGISVPLSQEQQDSRPR
ncbi:hypothetical protein [Halobellus ordinarius]|uniref:hypothetical protein n=1 Tax=Halobellus ordinarius TaxID=3075120 RepID=UPI0028801D41|nr:hypothetical protein [Halobellus sp. ZY16]